MPSDIYRGKSIEIENDELLIDGKKIDFILNSSGYYFTNLLPFSTFSSLLKMAYAIIENSPEKQ